MRKKGRKSSSSTGSGADSRTSETEEMADQVEESVFSQMRSVLLTEIGQENRPGVLKGVALAYYRQALQHRANGPAQRELLTLATAIDGLMGGKVASTVDLLIQRMKSSEPTMSGNHWSVSQRLEVLPRENLLITPGAELHEARRDSYADYRIRRDAGQPDGRPFSASKGNQAAKGEGKGDLRRQGGKKGGKGQGNKGDQGKKAKDEAARGDK